MSPSQLLLKWRPAWRIGLSLTPSRKAPVQVLRAEERGLPILVYVYLTDRDNVVRVRTVSINVDHEVDGLYPKDDARRLVAACLQGGFSSIPLER